MCGRLPIHDTANTPMKPWPPTGSLDILSVMDNAGTESASNRLSMLGSWIMLLVLMLPGCGSDPGDREVTRESTEQGELHAVVETDRGKFRMLLHADKTPRTVANFCNLVQRRFYDGLAWDNYTRVIRQTGRPGGVFFDPGYSIPREFHPGLFFDGPGDVALSKTSDDLDADAAPTKFFVTVKAQERWNLDFPIFANVVEGQEVVDRIQEGDVVQSIRLEGDPSPLLDRFADDIARWNQALDQNDPRIGR